jgi:hypothetical protein
MNRRLKMSMFAVLLTSSAVFTVLAVPGGACGMLAGCNTRENFTRCAECCYGAGCQTLECLAFCHNTKRRFVPGTPNKPYLPAA